jgi:DNA repair protein RadC
MKNSTAQINFGFGSVYNQQTKKNYFEQVKEELAIYGIDNVGVKELLAIIMGSNRKMPNQKGVTGKRP